MRHAMGQMDGQTERKADKMKQTVAFTCRQQKRSTNGKTCSCLRNTVIALDKMDCYFGTYLPCDFQAFSLKPYVIY